MRTGETALYLLRHGRLINTEKGIINGMLDTPLSKEGKKEMLRWAGIFKPGFFSVVISSDLKRTKDPAKILCDKLKCPLEIYPDLREINAGSWEGRRYADVMTEEQAYFSKRMSDPVRVLFPGGENLMMLKKRVKKRMDRIIKAHEGENILIVSHAGVIRTILLSYLGISLKNFFKFEIDFASLSVLRIFEDGNVTLKQLNTLPGAHIAT
jgi:alpha-ribazole phosphatase